MNKCDKESEEKAYDKLRKMSKITFFFSILITLGPLIFLITNIIDKNTDELTMNILMLAICSALVTFTFKNFAESYVIKENIFIEILKLVMSFLFFVGIIILLAFAVIMIFAGVSSIVEF